MNDVGACRVGHHVARQPELAVAGGGQEIRSGRPAADQDSEPTRFAPPARSKQMKGILPAPLVMLHCVAASSADVRPGSGLAALRRARTSAAREPGRSHHHRGLDRKPAAMKSRRVTGRGWSVVEDGLVELVAARQFLANDHRSRYSWSRSLHQFDGTAQHGRARRLWSRCLSDPACCVVAGVRFVMQRIRAPPDAARRLRRQAALMVPPTRFVDSALITVSRLLLVLTADRSTSRRAGSRSKPAPKNAVPRVVAHHLAAVGTGQLRDRGLVGGRKAVRSGTGGSAGCTVL